jgi:hypothetical protein
MGPGLRQDDDVARFDFSNNQDTDERSYIRLAYDKNPTPSPG